MLHMFTLMLIYLAYALRLMFKGRFGRFGAWFAIGALALI
jgi:hypothetical protein